MDLTELIITGGNKSTPCLLDAAEVCATLNEDVHKEFIDIANKNSTSKGDDPVKVIFNITGCNNEACVLKSRLMQQNMSKNNMVKYATLFKPKGPALKVDWLSNFNIDDVLKGYETIYKGFQSGTTTLSDFNDTHPFYNKNTFFNGTHRAATYFGFVVNTDESSDCTSKGCGSHWFACFVDLSGSSTEPWTIEVFDSVADRIYKPVDGVQRWIEWIKDFLKETRRVRNDTGSVTVWINKKTHQTSDTECGVYSLYYIYKRISGTDYKYFETNTINDSSMIDFRRNLFTPE